MNMNRIVLGIVIIWSLALTGCPNNSNRVDFPSSGGANARRSATVASPD